MSLTVREVAQQAMLIQEVMQAVMKPGEHYGKIPGCGDKPALLKAGAEKLSVTFRFSPKFQTEIIDMGSGHREYRVVTSIYHLVTGAFIAEGVGSCSTMEGKYRYRGGSRLCPHCGKAAIKKSKFPPKGASKSTPPGYYCFAKIGGCGAEFAHDDSTILNQSEEKTENPDIADTYNTVWKMAKKRSQVDATLTATGASDIFTQDIEELAEYIPDTPPVSASNSTPVTPSTREAPKPQNAAIKKLVEDNPPPDMGDISDLPNQDNAPTDVDQEPKTWRETKVHLGKKYVGRLLGELQPHEVEEIYNGFKPKRNAAGIYEDADLYLKQALVMWKAEMDQLV